MTDDDRLDPVIVERFRALDDVIPPDTWPAGSAGRTTGARRWPVAAAAAAIVLIVGSVVVLSTRQDGEGSIVGAPGTPAVEASAPSLSASTVSVVEDALATAEPAVVVPGQQVTITPVSAVERYCTGIVAVLPADGAALLGRVVDGSVWELLPGEPPVTWPACEGEFTTAPLTVIVPPIAAGRYRFCLAGDAIPEGCAVVTVVTAPGNTSGALAVAEPAVVTPGALVTITPVGAVQRYCADIVEVLPVGDGATVGQVLDGATWFAVPEGAAGPTWPACLGETTAAGLTFTVPPVSDGAYRFCIAEGAAPEGCAVVTVMTNGDQSIEPMGTATPASAVPGQLVSIAPTEPVRRACTDVVSVYSGATFLGSVGGPRFRPSPGEGDTLAACEGDVSSDPIDVFVPRLAPGPYVFCASDDLLPEGCAGVDVLPSPLLATVASSEVANGDTITITPAGSIDRICTGWVRVFDATLVSPIVEIIDPATGAFQSPAFGGWEAPDCEPQESAAAVTLTVPDVPLGAYAFCLSVEPSDESCALVYVTAKRLDPTAVPPASSTPPAPTNPPGATVTVEAGAFLGVSPGSLLADADAMIRDNTIEITDAQLPAWACASAGPRTWMTVLGGLTLVWEGDDLESAVGPKWRYVGGPAFGSEGITTDRGITVGSTRQSVVDAYGSGTGDVVYRPGYRLGFEGDVVAWLGNTGCAP